MSHEAIAVTPQPEATEAAVDVLRAGGNAVDAAIATAFVQGVVDPLMCGIGGFGSMAVMMPETGEHEYIDFHAPAPIGAQPDMWADLIESETRDGFGFVLQGRVNDIGHQSVCTPAALRAYELAHRRHGRMPWTELLGSAIAWARDGWMVRPHVANWWSDPGQMGRVANHERLSHTKGTRELYCREDGTPKRPGDHVINSDLSDLLSAVAKDGADAFYRGDIAKIIEEDMIANGGLLRRTDLEAIEPKVLPPLRGRYRGLDVTTNNPPGGGIMLLEMLGILERFDLAELGHNSPDYIRTVAEAMKRATADKDAHVGDPAFVEVDVDRLLSAKHLDTAAAAIRADNRVSVARFSAGLPSRDTTQISIVDAQGGCVSMTHSLGMPSGVVPPGLGFMFNGCMGVFDPRPGRAGSIAPGKARFSSICPSILLRDGAPVMVIGAPGATQIAMGVLQAVLNTVDFGMDIAAAVAAPRFSATSDVIDVTNRIPHGVTRELETEGYDVMRSPASFDFGWVHGITIDGGRTSGGADPATDGMAMHA